MYKLSYKLLTLTLFIYRNQCKQFFYNISRNAQREDNLLFHVFYVIFITLKNIDYITFYYILLQI